jgi:tRNA-guanine family transglycosylase
MKRTLTIGSQTLEFPTFLPVTTFGGKFPLDELVRPYLSRFCPATMVSYHYAQQMESRPRGLLFIDSGGFASLFDGSEAIDRGDFVDIRTKEGGLISPPEVLAFQEKHADIGATVDFIIPPSCPTEEAQRRQELTSKNAIWGITHRQKHDLALFASIQAWDKRSAIKLSEQLAAYPFDGFALGGMVPRIRQPEVILAIVEGIREVDKVRPLHVFGIGSPRLVKTLFDAGVDSTDSSSYVRSAVDGKWMDPVAMDWHTLTHLNSTTTRCQCAVCTRFTPDYLALEGESNRMALALHNLHVLLSLTTTDFSFGRAGSSELSA